MTYGYINIQRGPDDTVDRLSSGYICTAIYSPYLPAISFGVGEQSHRDSTSRNSLYASVPDPTLYLNNQTKTMHIYMTHKAIFSVYINIGT